MTAATKVRTQGSTGLWSCGRHRQVGKEPGTLKGFYESLELCREDGTHVGGRRIWTRLGCFPLPWPATK